MSLFSFQFDDAVFVPPADSASDYHDIDDNTIDHNEYPVDNKANDDENLQVSKLLNFFDLLIPGVFVLGKPFQSLALYWRVRLRA